jgi:hypothetical protein
MMKRSNHASNMKWAAMLILFSLASTGQAMSSQDSDFLLCFEKLTKGTSLRTRPSITPQVVGQIKCRCDR